MGRQQMALGNGGSEGDMALALNVKTPMLDAILEWNQRMIDEEYMVDGQLTGRDCGKAIIPSQFGFSADQLADQQVDRSRSARQRRVELPRGAPCWMRHGFEYV